MQGDKKTEESRYSGLSVKVIQCFCQQEGAEWTEATQQITEFPESIKPRFLDWLPEAERKKVEAELEAGGIVEIRVTLEL